jgi:hypothetical protein
MKRTVLTLFLTVVITAIFSAGYAEEAADIPLGRVKMRYPAKLDGKVRKDVAAVAAKIKKKRSAGVIKVRGDFPGAETAEEYLTKSVFMAREVERYLRTLLPANFQVYVTASGYSGARHAGENFVEIILYPHELRLEETESLRFVSTQANAPVETEVIETPVAETAVEAAPPAEAAVEGGMLSPPRDDGGSDEITSKREREKRSSEDPTLANELVRKAKARAAERAKRRAAEE